MSTHLNCDIYYDRPDLEDLIENMNMAYEQAEAAHLEDSVLITLNNAIEFLYEIKEEMPADEDEEEDEE